MSVIDQLNKKKKKNDWDLQKLQSLEIDFEAPLSSAEWTNLAEVLNEVGGMSWF